MARISMCSSVVVRLTRTIEGRGSERGVEGAPYMLLSGWMIVGFLFGILAGSVVTDLELTTATPKGWHFWRSTRHGLLLAALATSWVIILALLISYRIAYAYWSDPWVTERAFVAGTIVGAVGAPWAWLHFSRRFGSHGADHRKASDALIRARAEAIWVAEGRPVGQQDKHWERAEQELVQVEATAIEISEKSASQEI